MQKQGLIQSVVLKPNSFIKYTIDDQDYFLFKDGKESLVPLPEGALVDFEYGKSGDYFKLFKIAKAKEVIPQEPTQQRPTMDRRETLIVRQTSAKAAAELATIHKWDLAQFKAAAQEIENWITR
jgi:hypothetical protein